MLKDFVPEDKGVEQQSERQVRKMKKKKVRKIKVAGEDGRNKKGQREAEEEKSLGWCFGLKLSHQIKQ